METSTAFVFQRRQRVQNLPGSDPRLGKPPISRMLWAANPVLLAEACAAPGEGKLKDFWAAGTSRCINVLLENLAHSSLFPTTRKKKIKQLWCNEQGEPRVFSRDGPTAEFLSGGTQHWHISQSVQELFWTSWPPAVRWSHQPGLLNFPFGHKHRHSPSRAAWVSFLHGSGVYLAKNPLPRLLGSSLPYH